MLVGVATDDNRLSAPARMVELLDGREEGVEIDEQDRRALPRLQERIGKSIRHRTAYLRRFKRSSMPRPRKVSLAHLLVRALGGERRASPPTLF